MITADTMIYRYGVILALLFNVLATAILYVAVKEIETVATCAPLAAVANVFSYLMLVSALRQPKIKR